MRFSRCVVAFVAALCGLSAVAQAVSTPLVDVTGFGTIDHAPPGPVTDGWRFSLSQSMQVSHLGYFDADAVGLAQSHDVGLWTDAGVLLATATISNADPLGPDSFRYESIAPIVLGPGTYRIGGFRADGTDGAGAQALGLTTVPGSSYIDGRFTSGGSLAFPVSASGNLPSIFGPNLMVESLIPEPGTALLGVLGAAALARRRRRA